MQKITPRKSDTMVENFQDVMKKITKSKTYQTFKEDNPKYYMAHGFVQLDSEWNESKEWQLGLYSKANDNIAIFTKNPVKLQGYEKAFKEDGKIIEELKHIDKVKDVDTVLTTVKSHIEQTYPDERVRTTIVILQMIEGKPMFNITTVTESFTMIITKVDAQTADIVSSDKRSVLDLKKE